MNRKRRKRWATEEKLTTSITTKGCHFLLWTRNSLIKISFSSQTLQLTSSLNESKQIPPSNSNDLAKWSLQPPSKQFKWFGKVVTAPPSKQFKWFGKVVTAPSSKQFKWFGKVVTAPPSKQFKWFGKVVTAPFILIRTCQID